MKKFALVTLIIILLIEIPMSRVNALCDVTQTDYARIIDEDCPFYADPSLKIVKFYIPENYYVKIVSVGVEASRVIYMDQNSTTPLSEGYVKNLYLSFEDLKGNTIYPEITLTTISDTVIFTDTALDKPKAVLQQGVNAVFYGIIFLQGVEYVYVYSNGYIGYVRRDAFEPFDIPINYVEPVAPPQSNDSTNQSSDTTLSPNANNKNTESFGAQQVIVIAVMIIGALSLIFLILRPEKSNSKTRFFERDE